MSKRAWMIVGVAAAFLLVVGVAFSGALMQRVEMRGNVAAGTTGVADAVAVLPEFGDLAGVDSINWYASKVTDEEDGRWVRAYGVLDDPGAWETVTDWAGSFNVGEHDTTDVMGLTSGESIKVRTVGRMYLATVTRADKPFVKDSVLVEVFVSRS